MKRILITLTLLILTACGTKVHENISEEVIKDIDMVIEITQTAMEEDRDFTEREEKKLQEYKAKYNVKYDQGELTEEENRLFILGEQLIDDYDYYSLLETDRDYFDDTIKMIDRVKETGKAFD